MPFRTVQSRTSGANRTSSDCCSQQIRCTENETTDDATDRPIAGLIHGNRNQFLLYRELSYPAVTLRSVR